MYSMGMNDHYVSSQEILKANPMMKISATQIQENVRYVLSIKTVIRKTQIGANYQDTKDVSTAKELEMKMMTMCAKKVSKELISFSFILPE